MKKDTAKILQDYDSNLELYNDYCIKFENLLKSLLGEANINYHQLTKRVKTKVSLQGKIF